VNTAKISSSGGEAVKFYIGEEGNDAEFIIHKEQIQLSPVFQIAFNGGYMEGNTQTYRLTDTSEAVFRFMAQWLYTGILQTENYMKGLQCEGVDRNNGDHM
jgi:hypothetical protein